MKEERHQKYQQKCFQGRPYKSRRKYGQSSKTEMEREVDRMAKKESYQTGLSKCIEMLLFVNTCWIVKNVGSYAFLSILKCGRAKYPPIFLRNKYLKKKYVSVKSWIEISEESDSRRTTWNLSSCSKAKIVTSICGVHS